MTPEELKIKTIAKWRKSGLLEGLKEPEAEKMAQIMNNSAQMLLFEDGSPKEREVVHTFPIIRRTVESLFEKYGHEKFYVPTLPAFIVDGKAYTAINGQLPPLKDLISEVEKYAVSIFDADAEICMRYSAQAVESISKDIDNCEGMYALYTIKTGLDFSAVRYAIIK